MTQQHLSPDGRYRWDGQRWVPNDGPWSGGPAHVPGPMYPPPARPSRWPWYAAIGAVLLVGVCTVAVAGSGHRDGADRTVRLADAGATAPAAPGATAPPAAPAQPAQPARDGSCAPRPCANDNYGWIVAVNGFRYDAPSGSQFRRPEAGNVFVTVDVTFTNRLDVEQHTSPFNFVLRDGAGVKHAATWTASCPYWDAVNLTTGATLGPKCLAFQATAGKPNGLTLVWTPALPGGGDYDMPLS